MSGQKISQYGADQSPVTTDYVLGNKASGPSTATFKLSDILALFAQNIMAQMYNPYKFRVRRNAALNSASGASTPVAYDTKVFDTGSNVDVSTHMGRFTAPVAGFYQFQGDVELGSSSTSVFIMFLYKNGTQIGRGLDYRNSSTNKGGQVTDFIQLAAGDYIEINLYTDSAVGFDVTSAGQNTFSGYLVSIT